MIKKYFTRKGCPVCPYTNKGMILEWRIGYELTGTPSKANKRKGTECADVLGYQVKSPKASIIDNDNCDAYIFGFASEDFYYILTKDEMRAFLADNSYMDTGSKASNGKQRKVRVRDDSAKMRNWFRKLEVKQMLSKAGIA